jgi:hypothetical protein
MAFHEKKKIIIIITIKIIIQSKMKLSLRGEKSSICTFTTNSISILMTGRTIFSKKQFKL